MPKRKHRVVIDTNLWVSFLLSKAIIKLDSIINHENVNLLFSDELLEEVLEVIQRPKFKKYISGRDIEDLVFQIKEIAEFVVIVSIVDICRDPKDNFLLALAKDGKATHLISGDSDLLEIKKIGKTKIVTVAEYQNING
jgi:uncharacterized protein